jgi:16S rRNA (uracil1498-N3)-methyltransferase
MGDRQIVLTDAQQHYLRRVLRLQAGDRFIALDGAGHWFLSELTASSAQATVLEKMDAKTDGRQTELPAQVILLTAMPKQGMDDIVRQSTELGVAVIQLVGGDRTVLKPSPNKIERWQRIAQEAAEQSERQVIPSVLSPVPFLDALEHWHPAPHRTAYICAARQDAAPLLQALWQEPPQGEWNGNEPKPSQEYVIAIGPEGGWTKEELERAITLGYQPVSLGARILRAVTAPIVALSLISVVLESSLVLESNLGDGLPESS